MNKEDEGDDSQMKPKRIINSCVINSILLPEDKNALINFDYYDAAAEYDSYAIATYGLYQKQQPLSNFLVSSTDEEACLLMDKKITSCSWEEHCGIYFFHYALYIIMFKIWICIVIYVCWFLRLLFCFFER